MNHEDFQKYLKKNFLKAVTVDDATGFAKDYIVEFDNCYLVVGEVVDGLGGGLVQKVDFLKVKSLAMEDAILRYGKDCKENGTYIAEYLVLNRNAYPFVKYGIDVNVCGNISEESLNDLLESIEVRTMP